MKKIIYTIFLFVLWFCSIPIESFGISLTVHFIYCETGQESGNSMAACINQPPTGTHTYWQICQNYPIPPNLTLASLQACAWCTNCPTSPGQQGIWEANCYYIVKASQENDDDHDKEEGKKGRSCPFYWVGDPINVLTGNYTGQETDLEFKTIFDKGFSFYRTYRSRINVDSPIGYGWTHNYNIIMEHLGPDMARAYQIRDESNHIHYFEDNNGDNIYMGAMSSKGYIREENDGTFTWYRSNGIQYIFNSSRQLISKKDGLNNTQTLTYDMNNRLSTVLDQATGRSIEFYYNEVGRIDHLSGPITAAIPDGILVRYQYDTKGNLTRITYADGSGLEYRYQDTYDAHNLTEKRNLSGEFLASWQYDYYDKAFKNITRDGKGALITYGSFGDQAVVTDGQGGKKTYTFSIINGRKMITAVSQTGSCSSCSADAVRYVYDTQRRVIEKELTNGRIDKYQDYNTQDRYQTEIQASGTSNERIFYYTYHPNTGNYLTITEKSILGPTYSKQTIYDYDNDGNSIPNENPTTQVYRQIEKGYTKDQSGSVVPYEFVTLFTYNAKGQVLTVDGPKTGDQDKVTYTYYANGDLQSITQPLIGTTVYDQYDAAGYVGRVTDPNGLIATMTYDSRGRIKTRTTAANNAVITYNYNTTGDIASVTDAMGVTMTHAYETTYGRLDKITDPTGNYLKYSYDDKGNRIEQGYYKSTNTRTYQMRYNYQHPTYPGRLYKVTNPDNTFTEYNYDTTGNISSIKDPRGKTTTYQYDLFNRIKSVIQPGNVLTSYTYDSQDHLTAVTDAKNNTTQYVYDDLGRVLSVTSPDTGTATYVYDESNNLVSMIDSKNQETRFTYDVLNRVLTKRYYQNVRTEPLWLRTAS